MGGTAVAAMREREWITRPNRWADGVNAADIISGQIYGLTLKLPFLRVTPLHALKELIFQYCGVIGEGRRL